MVTAPAIGRAGWSERIREAWGHALGAVLEVGRMVAEAKAGLQHGEFEAMIREDLPFSAATARKLMAIAADERLANRSHVNVLPVSWGTLYELAQLGDEAFEDALGAGRIRPDMTRAEATRIRKAAALAAKRDAGDEFAGATVDDLAAAAAAGLKFGAIYADPPWQFETWGEGGKDRSPKYPTMTIDEIAALPVGDLAAEDCVLFLWVVNPLLREAFDVLDAWGFAYKTLGFDWVKEKNGRLFLGTGYWTRSNAELCLLATRGAPARDPDGADVEQVLVSEVMEHSRKPVEFMARIERLVPGPYLEVFARRRREGWSAWGNQVPADALGIEEGGA